MAKRWICPPDQKNAEEELKNRLHIGPLLARALVARGMTTPEDAAAFLQEQPAPFYDPFLLPDMDKAVKRIRAAIAKKEKITVYGDYDADGVSATAILLLYLRAQGADADYYIPSRLTEGYGMNADAVTLLKERGTSLILTVDTGIAAIEEANLVRSLGMELIVTDHHQFSGTLPDAYAVVSARVPGNRYPFTELCGAGIAFKLVTALSEDAPEVLFEQFGELLSIATVADLVPLTDENRAIVRRAIKKMRKDPSVPIRALLSAAGFSDVSALTSTDIAYYLSPMINAAGRLGSAEKALSLFLAEDPETAKACAEALVATNGKRREIEAAVSSEAFSMIDSDPSYKKDAILVVAKRGWHSGVVGIAAARLVGRYEKPAIILSIDDNGTATGSGRSIEGVDLYTLMIAKKDMLIHAGGHPMACGLTLAEDKIADFRAAINAYATAQYPDGLPLPTLKTDGTASLEELTTDTVAELGRLSPFGTENPAPLFIFPDLTVKTVCALKEGRHLKMTVAQGGKAVDSIGFSLGAWAASLKIGQPVRLAARPDLNEFRGTTSVQLKTADVAPCPPKEEPSHDGKTCPPHIRAILRQRLGVCYTYLVKQSAPFFGTYTDLAFRLSTAQASFSPSLAKGAVSVLSELKLLNVLVKDGQIEILPVLHAKKTELENSPTFWKLIDNYSFYLEDNFM